MRLASVTLGLALCLMGCGLEPGGDPVLLATGVGEFPVPADGSTACITYDNVGLLIDDPETGTAAQGDYGIRPLIWPVGYTARRLAGGEIVVLNGKGDVVATTGRKYQFWTGSWGGAPPVRSGPVHTGGPGCVNEWKPGG
jgi:hypothetical protein